MSSFNKVMLMGNLTRDPEVRYTPKGTAVAQIGMAINRVWTNDSGEKKEEVTFVDVEFWGRTAETVGQYMHKGSPIFIEGRLKLDSWEDKESGQKRSKLKVVGEGFQFVGSSGKDNGGGEGEQRAPSIDQQARQAPARKAAAPEARVPASESEDAIPF